MSNPQYLTVHALTKYIKRKFDADPHLADVYVKGEISNFKQHSSGHMYFTLKDNKARILAVMFAAANRKLKFTPENGMNVMLRGSISVFEGSGQYQIYAKDMQPDGVGALYLAYEQLKEKLSEEGLFAPERKRPLPAYPNVIGVITSPTGAAVRDIITTIKRRYPIGKIILHPALVQGEKAAESIAAAIQKANDMRQADVLIVGRGGGSIEELWAFNEEIVARAIHHSEIPIISAVGHETDSTIADFAADLRAPTPTGAAELAVPHIDELMERVLNRKARLIRSVSDILRHQRKRLEFIERSYIFRNPYRLYEPKLQQLDRLNERLTRDTKQIVDHKSRTLSSLQQRLVFKSPSLQIKQQSDRFNRTKKELLLNTQRILKEKQQEFSRKLTVLEALSPLKVMERGYSLAYSENENLLKSVDQTKTGDQIQVMLSDGTLSCTVDQIERRKNHDG
ncbi:exodeoxyribonuclease VII large subunit [Heyndrickxia acidicola]|uniref:Exodeoxyribonuclease 7 large subunit n=1 Tax=Heyndrickxia acidicola TaxID=209389 RepID=A0ABU6MKG3_9BACI|nr:exodeoxyribonuclease VII large subunit [Heyndrickxia acidicola]MED1205180.1 exodeoxyribonuclease VII large subunit [Heyndrickxia acidicola]